MGSTQLIAIMFLNTLWGEKDALQWIWAMDVFEEFRFEAGPTFMVFQNWRGKNPGQPRVMDISRGIYMLFGTDEK